MCRFFLSLLNSRNRFLPPQQRLAEGGPWGGGCPGWGGWGSELPARTLCSSLWRRRCGCGLGEESGVLPAPTSPPNTNLVLTSGGRPCHAAPCRPGRDCPRQRSSRGSACASRAASNAGKRHRRVSCGRASGRSGGPDPASAVAGQRGASEASDRACARAQTHSVGDGAGVTLNSNVIGPHALHSGGDRPLPHVLPWAEGVCTAWGPWEKAAEKME